METVRCLCVLAVSGLALTAAGSVELAQSQRRPAEAAKADVATKRSPATLSFAIPTAEFPHYSLVLTVPRASLSPGKVTRVDVNGKKNRDARYFSSDEPPSGGGHGAGAVTGESLVGIVDGAHDFHVIAPENWTNGSKHLMRMTITRESGEETDYEAAAVAPDRGGYWNADWPRSVSLVVEETAGVAREREPVHVTVGLFADDVSKPENEIRVVTYDPLHPQAGADGWVVAPTQVTNVAVWRDERLLNSEERDPETGQVVHRYAATTSVELVFLADVAAHASKVYLLVFGNAQAPPLILDTDLKVRKGERMSQTVENRHYSYFLSVNSGAVESVTVRGAGEPVVFEHKLETNGAVHWNPGIYSPPTPWVHASDWETPIYSQVTGPLLHRTRRYAPLPLMDSVTASVSYSFYAGKPYVLMSSFMEVGKDIFVQALRNGELVFNHAVLNEFVWQDPRGAVKSLDIESSRKHPVHALEVPADTPWMAFINREKQVGFAHLTLVHTYGNRYGQPASVAQPYFYVQNGPWIYWSRPMVYPFGSANFTRMMPVRAGSFYLEQTAWVAFRFAAGEDPLADIKVLHRQLTNPLRVHEWMATHDRTPEAWIMPILTMPFDEGVADAIGGQKAAADDAKQE